MSRTARWCAAIIGVEAQPLTGTTAKALGLPENSGALLAGVQPDTPASHAGLQPGDVIQSVNGEKIANPRDLAVDVAAIKPGQEAHLKVLHDGNTKDVTLNVAQMPNEQTASNEQGGEHGQGQIGLALEPLSPGLRNQLNVPDGVNGAVVRGVQPGSPADIAGLQPGDVIVGVNMHAVNSAAEAARDIRSAIHGKDHAVALRVIRDGQAMFVGVTRRARTRTRVRVPRRHGRSPLRMRGPPPTPARCSASYSYSQS